ncbi:hypothetical protein N9Q24_01110 [Flavobacteriaceae bacterium]|nr:hypothetical protein [Flavobacteriaceae bacterium]
MKKIIVLITLFVSLSACKNDQKTTLVTTENSNLAVYKGEFIFTETKTEQGIIEWFTSLFTGIKKQGAAVLKGSDFIYGVVVDDKMKELADKVAPAKKDVYDMVPVIVTGTLAPGPQDIETWDEFLTIIDIVQVSAKPAKADVKIKEGDAVKKSEKAIKKVEEK